MHKQTTKQLYEAWAPRMSSCSGASALSFGIFNRTMRTNQLPQLLFKTALIIEGNTKHALYFEGAAASERSISHIVGYCGLIVFTLLKKNGTFMLEKFLSRVHPVHLTDQTDGIIRKQFQYISRVCHCRIVLQIIQ